MASQRHPFNNSNNQGYLPNGGQAHQGAVPGAIPLLPNQGRIIQSGPIRLLCIADVRGNLRSLNELAKNARADYILHTGDFGFYDESSLERIAEKTLKHVAQYSPLIADHVKKVIVGTTHGPVKSRFSPQDLPLSELPLLLSGDLKLDVPVYTVWGACEDVRVLEKFRSKAYKVNNLFIVDEAQSMLLEVAGVKLRLLGLGGAVVMHKLFDNGEGRTTIAGGQGTMWTTLLQMGELVDTANRVYDPTETRLFITHASPAREGILNQLSVALKADFSISAGLHFRYGSSYNEFSVNPTLDHYRGKLASSKASFNDVWDTVKNEVEPAISQNEAQQLLLKNALGVVDKMPSTAAGGNPFGAPVNGQAAGQVDESAFKNMWNFNLADAAFGYLVLEIHDGRIGTEMRAQGFNFSHRGAKQPAPGPQTGAVSGPQSASVLTPSAANAVPVSINSAQPQLPQTNMPSAAPTPAPSAIKSSTPAPSASPAPQSQDRTANDSSAAPASTTASPAPRGDVFIGLFVANVTDDEARAQFDTYVNQTKITTVAPWGKDGKNRVVCFASEADRDEALEWLNNTKNERTPRLRFSVYQTQGRPDRQFSGARGGAGNWASSRGGGGGGGGAGRGEPGNISTGYTASDSERDGNRRGGRSGGRGRGGDRGGRGPRGRGGIKGGDGGSNGSPAPSSAAPADS